MARFYAGDRDAPFPSRDGLDRSGGWQPGQPGLRKNDYTSLQVRELAGLVRYPLIAASAAALSGAESIRLWHDQLLYKPPGTGADPSAGNVGWHTDRQYWLTCTSSQMLTAWVPFHDVDGETGTIAFLDGSHRWDANGLDFFDHDLDRLEDRLRAQGLSAARRPAVLKRGQVSFHQAGTVHGSGPNRSSGPRRSLAIHLQAADNHYQLHTFPDGTVAQHYNDTLVRSTASVAGPIPDYTDPRVCPVLWSDPAVSGTFSDSAERVLRRRFAMTSAHAGCSRPGVVRCASLATWCTCTSPVR
jgi:hypothetical protein